jgi:hypothetical protein
MNLTSTVHLSLSAEPFIRVPIREVGWGNVKLYSVGSFVSPESTNCKNPVHLLSFPGQARYRLLTDIIPLGNAGFKTAGTAKSCVSVGDKLDFSLYIYVLRSTLIIMESL